MLFKSPTARISLCLVCIATSVFFLALTFRLLPDPQTLQLDARKNYCENLALHCSVAVQRDDYAAVKELVLSSVRRQPELLSAGVRTAEGELLVEVGEHAGTWDAKAVGPGYPDQVQVPLLDGEHAWGRVELRFKPLQATGVFSLLSHPLLPFVAFFTPATFLAFFLFVRLMFRQLNMSQARVVPDRVRTTLNTLAEGVVILDKEGNIVLANDAFADTAGLSPGALQGRKVSELVWKRGPSEEEHAPLPWERALEERKAQTGAIVGLTTESREADVLSVNSIPIFADDGTFRGALASFDNLTEIQQKNAQLKKLLGRLQRSRGEIQRQNKHLRDLATKDSLTGCLNRRAFFAEYESHWSASQQGSLPLSCVMVDVDHFKLVNDNHGHATGDHVLQQVAATLRESVRKDDLVCRYGGEEFCILLVGHNLTEAAQAGERVRAALEACHPAQLDITASVGVSSICLGAASIHEMLDQADKALYVAKRTGRNRVCRWDMIPFGQTFEKEERKPKNEETTPSAPISFQAVNVLLAPLGYRHPKTVEHSRRVADLCVAVADRLLSQQDCYVLEVAALLHDVGKLIVPDAILNKPGPLSADEWKVLRTHETLGIEMVATVLGSKPLTDLVRYHHVRFAGGQAEVHEFTGKDLPLGARVLAVADAFDTMISDQVYRPRISQEAAFAELRRCAGEQFDPDIVERLIETVQRRDEQRSAPQSVEQAALRFGLQLERIAIAADAQDRSSLIQMVGGLQAMANESGIMPIADAAAQLIQLAESGMGMPSLTTLTLDLIDMCRATYRVNTSADAEEGSLQVSAGETLR